MIGEGLSGGEIILLTGDLGAGKSVFARGVTQALGIDRWRGSPTFALVHEYHSEPVLIHVDLYRLGPEEVEELGLEEYAVPSTVLLVEWADRADGYLRALPHGRCIQVDLEHGRGDSRTLVVSSDTLARSGRDAC